MESRSTQDARRDFAALIEDVLRGEHVELTRYGRPVAVIVPSEWHKQASDARAVVAEMLEHIASGDDYADPAKVAEWRQRAGLGIGTSSGMEEGR